MIRALPRNGGKTTDRLGLNLDSLQNLIKLYQSEALLFGLFTLVILGAISRVMSIATYVNDRE